MGSPEEDDPSAYATRGLVGGLAAGGALGAGAGIAHMAGKLPIPERFAGNAAARYLARLAEEGGAGALAKGAGIGALAGGAAGTYKGWEEGSALDSIDNAHKHHRRRQSEEESA
jgi:hypothetical protein